MKEFALRTFNRQSASQSPGIPGTRQSEYLMNCERCGNTMDYIPGDVFKVTYRCAACCSSAVFETAIVDVGIAVSGPPLFRGKIVGDHKMTMSDAAKLRGILPELKTRSITDLVTTFNSGGSILLEKMNSEELKAQNEKLQDLRFSIQKFPEA